MKKYDVAVIGTGAGNIVLEAALLKGLKCAQIEKGKFGGTCLTRGCIPTKVMVTAADMINDIKNAEKIGVLAENPRIDWNKLSERVHQKITVESEELYEYYLNTENLDVYRASAEFVDNHTIKVTHTDSDEVEEIQAEKIFINVGGRTKIPAIENLEEVGYITSESLFGDKYPKKPYKSLIVVGGGPIGAEFAHVFNSFGAKVNVIQHNVRMLPKEDEEISEQIRKDMVLQGINLYLNKDTVSARKEGDLKYILFRDRTTGEEMEVSGEEILISPGIMSNADTLKLENTDIETDSRGWIVTNEFLETSVENIWALGDVNGKQQFRHKANYEGYILAHNIFEHEEKEDNFRWAEYGLVPAVTFTYPQVGHVGMTEKQAREKGYDVMIAKNYYSQTAKGFAMGFNPGDEDDGFVKLVADRKTGEFLGAHVIGPEASILFQPYLNLMNAGEKTIQPVNEHIASELTKKLRERKIKRNLEPHKIETVRETMVPHPTLSEIVIWAADNFEDYK